MRCESDQTRVLKLGISKITAVRDPIFDGWHKLEMFAVTANSQHLHYTTVPGFWRNLDVHRMLCLRLSSMVAYHTSTFGDEALRLGQLLFETTMNEFTIVFFV